MLLQMVALSYHLCIVWTFLCGVFQSYSAIQNGWCTCDLLINGCDPNCCCDADCSQNDKLAFAFCMDAEISYAREVCVSDTLLYSADKSYAAEGSGSGLLCIYNDNYQERNFYSSASIVTTGGEFQTLYDQYSSTSFQSQPSQDRRYSDQYKYGDPLLLLLDDNIVSYLRYPRTFTTSACEDANLAGFLQSAESSCTRLVRNVEVECASSESWSMLSYVRGFKFLPYPSILNEAGFIGRLVKAAVVFPLKCVNSAGLAANCSFEVVQSPSYNKTSGSCENVVKRVDYIITYNSTSGSRISGVSVRFLLDTVRAASSSFQQTHQIRFTKDATGTAFRRSGNPGYVYGLPLVAGTRVTNPGDQKEAILLSVDPGSWLTILKTPSTAACSDVHERTSVLFGIDMRAACFVSIKSVMTLEDCRLLQDVIYNVLLAGLPTHVAMFGSSSPANVADWAPLIKEMPSAQISSSSGHCQNVVVGTAIEILFSRAGYIGNAQNKIAGVRVKFGAPQDLPYRCFGVKCQLAGQVQLVEVVQAVTFVDVSTTPQAKIKPTPRWKSKAPYDFFYPFV